MVLNAYIWKNYKDSKEGQRTIQVFKEGSAQDIISLFNANDDQAPAFILAFRSDEVIEDIADLHDFCVKPQLPQSLTPEKAQKLSKQIIEEGFTLRDDNGTYEISKPDELIYRIPSLSTWLYFKYPTFFKPYFFSRNFHLLTRIANAFDFDLPKAPLKRYWADRLRYYFDLCKVFAEFEIQYHLSSAEMCAFLYDFAPRYVEASGSLAMMLPQPTQVWMIGANKAGGDFDFLDEAKPESTHFWQGNEETKRGDILVMYCLSPRSYIHSVWRAMTDGISDPLSHFYGSVYIGQGQQVKTVTYHELKADSYFKKHPLARKNFQGLNDRPLTAADYQQILKLIRKKGGAVDALPQLYGYEIQRNMNVRSERDVELQLIEPLLEQLGYTTQDWVRQLSVRMGRGERNYPDYAFLTSKDQDFEQAWMLIESKWAISNNRELEEAFRQVWSYGQRLGARTLVIADKDSIWVYERQGNVFDRTIYRKFYWSQLKQSVDFNQLKKLVGKF
ncbi:hypothetical protein [uncultured Spirosoma sp.]|uniref:hypothetical protein n=1 Tax=uncultured Spirosoma sp. TaxID=278208 RepID=UPI0025884E58|nr:hypothetical protein [uncultured Spirosoma sp.]